MTLLFWGIGCFLAGGVATLSLRSRPQLVDRLFRLALVAGAVLTIGPALGALASGTAVTVAWRASVPGGPWVLGLDALSAWFLLVIAGVGATTGVYGIAYLAPERSHRSVAAAHATFAVLLASMIGVVLARAVIPFLIAWELMAVSAYLLIVFEGEKREVQRSGLIYLVLTHTGTLALFAMFLVWGRGGPDLTFASLAASSPHLTFGGALVLGLALVGFGVKAGLVPMHFWLPGAHAAAPSHVSAVLSGVMIKTGIYGLLRVLTLIGTPPAWWGWTLLGLGLLSGVLGVLWALAQPDLKRVLAYSTVEHAGIILLGMGVGALGLTYQQPVVAALGMTGAVLHTLNHALFKSLLFLGAGAVLRSTGIQAIDRLGGLARRMPWTALSFMLASVAIVGIPPLNGFVSEWVLFQALLRGGSAPGVLRIVILAGAALALIGAVALACFTRASGAVFLGHGRSREAEEGREAPLGMLAPMFALGLTSVTLGVLPLLAIPAAVRVAGLVLGLPPAVAGDLTHGLVQASRGLTGLAAGIVALATLAWLGRRYSRWAGLPAAAPTWGCGFDGASSRMQYTASSYGSPILAVFGAVAAPAESRGPTWFATDTRDRVLAGAILPFWTRVTQMAASLRPLHQGRLTRYLQYIVLTVLVLLAVLFASVRAGR